ncbi:hypothetical protein WK43_28830 [Burkholderia ubonensis]|nr:hypothetical protein WK38_22855 [Burkholderia ubonensis]KVS72225.1 hypothetical protein WK42_24345 [Burkholderia ubonensis]KVS80533.1 hypothetical protein WK43_28830 [Burkholderia ubonensis]KVS95710.1 hypothetical protein WK44_06550 [Burkholderia ubonensis]KWO15616.1 hypothetical protein WM27_26695 [Burkholderia ubonensis]
MHLAVTSEHFLVDERDRVGTQLHVHIVLKLDRERARLGQIVVMDLGLAMDHHPGIQRMHGRGTVRQLRDGGRHEAAGITTGSVVGSSG